MAAPSIRLEGKRWGGCHCSKCMGASQQESKGKGVEEAQSRAPGNGSLAEHCFVAENSVEERRIMANLEKTMHAVLGFAGGGEEPDNSLWIV